MLYLIFKILIFLLAALLLGWFLGSSYYRLRSREQIAEVQAKLQANNQRLQEMQEEVNAARQTSRAETQARERMENEAEALRASEKTAQERISAAISRAEALEASLDKERQVLTEADDNLRQLREEHQRTLQSIEEQGKKQQDWTSQLEARQTEVEVLTRDRDTWQSDAQASLRRVQELEAEVRTARARAEAAESERLALRVQHESDERRIEEMVLRSNVQTDEMTALMEKVGALEAQMEAAPEAKVAPISNDLPALNEAGFFASRPAEVDDLKKISGVGPKLERLLNELGIYQYQQIALLTRAQIAWVNDQLSFKGRIERDNWIKQAALLGGIATATDEQPEAEPLDGSFRREST